MIVSFEEHARAYRAGVMNLLDWVENDVTIGMWLNLMHFFENKLILTCNFQFALRTLKNTKILLPARSRRLSFFHLSE